MRVQIFIPALQITSNDFQTEHLGTVLKVRTLKFDNFQTPPPPLYAFKQ